MRRARAVSAASAVTTCFAWCVGVSRGGEVVCAPGLYLSRDAVCLACPEGSFSGAFDNSAGCQPCFAGYFGARRGASSGECSGLCAAGHFCPAGARSSTAKSCGGAHVFCPAGSAAPVAVAPGHYSVGGDALGLTRDAQRLCEAGSYCVGGVRLACPAGTYNARRGSSAAADCFAAEPGSFAPEGSAAAAPCPAGTFGAGAGLSQPSCSGPCAPGYYCPAGSTRADAVACPAGRVGAQAGLSSASCSPLCERATGLCVDALSECPQGSFCGPASAAPLPCGGPTVYCPRGSPAPLPVSAGFFSDGGGARQRACPRGSYCAGGLRLPCPEGTGGESEALQSAACSGPCEAGYYCEQGSPSLFQHRCGHGAFCPQGSWRPNPVAHGWFATGGRDSTTRSAQQPCDVGHYCVDGLKLPCPAGAYAPDAGRDSCLACPRGHFCPPASVQPQRCPAGTWGGAEGLATPGCSGPCRAGYYCPEGSTSAAQVLCSAGADAAPEQPLPAGAQEGATYGSAPGLTGVRLRDAVFCPAGSPAPQAVLPGHAALGGRQGARTYQAPCADVTGEWRFDSACDRGEFVPGSLV